MVVPRRSSRFLGCAVLVAACRGGGTDEATTTAGSTGPSTSGTTAASTSAGTTTDGTTTGGGQDGECILWEQDCTSPDLKCMPWSADPDRVPDETKCCPLVDAPKQVGEDCSIQEYDGSCLDDCDEGAVCVQDDPDTLSGVCGELCNVEAPTPCPPGQTCKPFFENLPGAPVVPICMDQCDPLLQDCARPGWSCIPDSPTASGMSGFLCAPPPPGDRVPMFGACALANDCEPGLACVPADLVPGCTFLFCCTSYCNLGEPDPCPGYDPSMMCVDWQSPDPMWDHVGVCVVPV